MENQAWSYWRGTGRETLGELGTLGENPGWETGVGPGQDWEHLEGPDCRTGTELLEKYWERGTGETGCSGWEDWGCWTIWAGKPRMLEKEALGELGEEGLGELGDLGGGTGGTGESRVRNWGRSRAGLGVLEGLGGQGQGYLGPPDCRIRTGVIGGRLGELRDLSGRTGDTGESGQGKWG